MTMQNNGKDMTTTAALATTHESSRKEACVSLGSGVPSSSLTHNAVMLDLASWWSYAILKRGDIRLFHELERVLESLPLPIPSDSSLCSRLRCLVPWQELLKQLYTQGCTVGKKRFESIQDKLLLLRQDLSAPKIPDSASEDDCNDFYQNEDRLFADVLRMLQTHSVLSNLYSYLSQNGESNSESEMHHMLDECLAKWESIYVGCKEIPPSLIDLVNKTNQWDFEDRKDHIIQIVSFRDSTLTYKRLKHNVQQLLLYWFENKIMDDATTNQDGTPKVPELLEKNYRGIGFRGTTTGIMFDRSEPRDFRSPSKTVGNADENAAPFSKVRPLARRPKNHQLSRRLITRNSRTKHAIARPQVTKQLDRVFASMSRPIPQSTLNRRCRRKRRQIPLDINNSAYNLSSDDDDDEWDQNSSHEKFGGKINARRERKRRYKRFLKQQKQNEDRRSAEEEQLTMPVGEPSYSEATLQKQESSNRHDHRLILEANRYQSSRQSVGVATRGRDVTNDVHDDSSESDSEAHKSESTGSGDDVGNESTWTAQQDDALRKGMQYNGYGNWNAILSREKLLLGSKSREDIRIRATMLLQTNR